MKGLRKLGNQVIRTQALGQFETMASIAENGGAADLVKLYQPDDSASLDMIDQATDDLRAAYAARAGINLYVAETE